MELLFVLHMRPQPPSVHGCKKQLNEAARRSQECRSELISYSQSQLAAFFVPTAFIDITAIYPRRIRYRFGAIFAVVMQ